MRFVALAAVVLGALVQVPFLIAQTGDESQSLVPVGELPQQAASAPRTGAVSAPEPAQPAPEPAPPAAELPPADPAPLMPTEQVAAGSAPALEPTEELEADRAAAPLGELAQVETVPADPPSQGEEQPPSDDEDEIDPEEFEREFDDLPAEDMPPLERNPRPRPPVTVATTTHLPQTGSELIFLELVGGLLMGAGLALRLALRPC